MAQTHFLYGLGDPFWLFPIQANWTSRVYGAEAAATRTDAAQDHKSGGFLTPAFANIGAARLLTDCVQFFATHQVLEAFVVFALWRAHPQPFWTALWNGSRHFGFLVRGRDTSGPHD